MKYNLWWSFKNFTGFVLAAIGLFGAFLCALGFLVQGIAIVLSVIGVVTFLSSVAPVPILLYFFGGFVVSFLVLEFGASLLD